MTTSTERFRLRIYLTIFITVMILGTLGFMNAEALSPLDAIYFTIVTIATVGYGDISPVTTLGKCFAILLIVTGVGTFLGVVANATELFLSKRETRTRLQKLHMVIGLYFSEVGGTLLKLFTQATPEVNTFGDKLIVTNTWSSREFQRLRDELKARPFQVDGSRIDLEKLRIFLNEKGNFLVRLLENPYLLEHEMFTDLLIATLHLKEECMQRDDFSRMPETDLQHLTGDMNRVYLHLLRQWVDYMEHLKQNYPFLFSLAMRTNPFDREASPVVR